MQNLAPFTESYKTALCFEISRTFPLNPQTYSIMYRFALYVITGSMGLLALIQRAACFFYLNLLQYDLSLTKNSYPLWSLERLLGYQTEMW